MWHTFKWDAYQLLGNSWDIRDTDIDLGIIVKRKLWGDQIRGTEPKGIALKSSKGRHL